MMCLWRSSPPNFRSMALAALPIINAVLMNANDFSKPLHMCAEIWMTQEATDESRGLIR
jgi:hypothetical protein